ncbi:MAG TPA: 4-hydroxy-tetrahydrodipicolinate reductase [Bacteroidales bacterium]|nr:4-hydroxy-tetrahydrodipicolinate reductase [Bacteroidales bacterium]
MKIAIIGYGKMGKTIESIAKERGHTITAKIDQDSNQNFDSEAFMDSDVAIEFTQPNAAVENFKHAFERKVPVVSGTTGWLDHYEDVINTCKKANSSFFYASNFSIGVNILFAMNKKLASIMEQFNQYNGSIEETHHIHKKDAPSGTAISLAEGIASVNKNIKGWYKTNEKKEPGKLPITSIREGEIFGEHIVRFDSDVDYLELKHHAKSRNGFALGAVMAAEYIQGKTGIYSMKDMLSLS